MEDEKIELKEKKNLNSLFAKNTRFKEIIEKLTTESVLSFEDKKFILACAILFVKEFDNDKRYKSYADLAYYIILRYSINCNDFQPLFDFSSNFGFYPVNNLISKTNLIDNSSLNNLLVNIQVPEFQKGTTQDYIETLEQHNVSNDFLESKVSEKCFIAPTSYGKSSIIIDYLKSLNGIVKVGIIVPTKSLLMQTYKMVRDSNLNYKFLIHEEMYDNDKNFIAVFTQERALRLLRSKRELNVFFDVLIIDEAHNLLKKVKTNDNRSILLSRLIRLNEKLNPNHKILYLSPLISDTNCLMHDDNQIISSHHIYFNIKSPEFFEYKIDGTIVKHNRFFLKKGNEGFNINIEKISSFFDYIIKFCGNKNFIYYNTPPIIEKLAIELSERLDLIIQSKEINELIKTLEEEVHKKFYCVDLLKKGVIYLHGKLPDTIKEYLEYKFKEISEIKFLVANTVILEGVNLPIDKLFILNSYNLHGKELTNLVGRVNRLNEIFKEGNIKKLLPQIHFVNNEFLGKKNNHMFNKILELRSRAFEDIVENPTLVNFKLKNNDNSVFINKIIEDENFLLTRTDDELIRLKQYLIENGINLFYDDTDLLVATISNKISSINVKSESWKELSIINKIYQLFIESNSDTLKIVDSEFYRLNEEKARNYYETYVANKKNSLKQNVTRLLNYLLVRRESIEFDEHIFYIGKSYGEIKYSTQNSITNDAVNLKEKTEKELVNLSIIKLKLEDDFISFKLNKFIVFLYDFKLIDEGEYNLFIYGTVDNEKIKLTKFGLNISLIEKLFNDNQIVNLSFDFNNNLECNEQFLSYLETLNDFQRFEIEKFLVIKKVEK